MAEQVERIKINFVGDVCLSGINAHDFQIQRDVAAQLKTAHLNVANLECPLTFSDRKEPNHPVHLKAQPDANPIIDWFHIFSLANNHIMDYGEAGLRHTREFLGGQGKQYFGAGGNEQQAYAPLLVEHSGFRLAFLGFSRWHQASKKSAGTTPDNISRLKQIVERLKQECYFVIVYPHWNYEYVYYPAPESCRLAHRLIEAGADLIVGSHPHIIQGYEKYQGKWIFYSLGNFIFHSSAYENILMFEGDPRVHISAILSFELSENGELDFQLFPVFTDNRGIEPLSGEQKEEFERLIYQISEVLQDPGRSRLAFYRESRNIVNRSSKVLKMVAREQGVFSQLKLLSGIRSQDIKIKLHALFK